TIRNELEQTAGNINGRFAEVDWVPIRYLNRAYDRSLLMALFRLAGVGLVTPIRDGMNLVAKEYVASQDPRDPGVLVLSKLAGAAIELSVGAVLVNPYDREGVAEGLERAISMPLAERRERHRAMIQVLERNDIHAWCRRFLDALGRVSGVGAKPSAMHSRERVAGHASARGVATLGAVSCPTLRRRRARSQPRTRRLPSTAIAAVASTMRRSSAAQRSRTYVTSRNHDS